MNNRDSKIILEDDQSEFLYRKNKLKLNISFAFTNKLKKNTK